MSTLLYKGQGCTLSYQTWAQVPQCYWVPCSMRGLSSPWSRNLVDAKIYWGHGEGPWIFLRENFRSPWCYYSKTFSPFSRHLLGNLNGVTGGSLGNMTHSGKSLWRSWDALVKAIWILKRDQSSSQRTDVSTIKHLIRKILPRREVSQFFFSYFYPNKLCPAAATLLKPAEVYSSSLRAWWSVWCVKWARIQYPGIQTNTIIGVAM